MRRFIVSLIRRPARHDARRLAFGRGFVVAGLVLLLFTPGVSVSREGRSLTQEERERIDAIFETWNRVDSPGAALAIARGGEIVYKRGYGSANLEYGIPITPQTVFHVASVSKQFTTFAALLLEQDGKLSLDDAVQQHIPELPEFGPEITLRHLGYHQSGLRDQWELLAMSGWRLDDVITTDQILRVLSRQRELNFQPGAETLYSNSGFTLLGQVVARASEQTFPEFARKRIFEPLSMSRTHFHDNHQHVVPGRAYSYAEGEDGYINLVLSYANAGATSLFTTVEDLVRWLHNLDVGTVGGADLIEAMHRRGVHNDGEESDFGLGLIHSEYRGLAVVGHSGGDAGFRSWAGRFPEHDLAVVVLSNLASFNASGQAMDVAAVLLEEHLNPEPSETAEEIKDSTDETIELTAAQRERLVGRYQLNLGLVIELVERDDHLEVVAPEVPRSPLVARTPLRLFLDETSATLDFELGDDGRASSVSISLPGQRLRGERIEPEPLESLRELVGSYYSEELLTSYELELTDDGMLARHQRHDPVKLSSVGKDELAGDQWWFGRLVFVRGEAGEITGFRLTGGRVRHLLFVRR